MSSQVHEAADGIGFGSIVRNAGIDKRSFGGRIVADPGSQYALARVVTLAMPRHDLRHTLRRIDGRGQAGGNVQQQNSIHFRAPSNVSNAAS
jgi:hypothetical protein